MVVWTSPYTFSREPFQKLSERNPTFKTGVRFIAGDGVHKTSRSCNTSTVRYFRSQNRQQVGYIVSQSVLEKHPAIPFLGKWDSAMLLRTNILPRFSGFDRSSLVCSSKRYLHKWPQNSLFLPAPPAKQAKIGGISLTVDQLSPGLTG